MTTPNDALDFYPTPDNLAWEMVHSLETEIHGFRRFPSPVLEPSAADVQQLDFASLAAGLLA